MSAALLRGARGAVKLAGAVLAAQIAAAALAWGCSGSSDSGTSGSIPKIQYDGSSEGCSVHADGVCDIQGGESCACEDCVDTAYCLSKAGAAPDCAAPKQRDGVCDPIEDYCVCDDCLRDPYCQDPLHAACGDAGACEGYREGCLCPGCEDAGSCAKGRERCLDGGTSACDKDEDCACIECLLAKQCCVTDGVCSPLEPCTCDDCAADPHCTSGCDLDKPCDVLHEGCSCVACASECSGGASGSSGTAGAGGASASSSSGAGGAGGTDGG